MSEISTPDSKPQAVISILKSADNRKKNNRSLFMLLAGEMGFLIFGAVTLRTDLILTGLVPFILTGYEMLLSARLFSGLKKYPLKAHVSIDSKTVKQGTPFEAKITVYNYLPFDAGNLNIRILSESGLYVDQNINLYLNRNSKVIHTARLHPMRPGPLFFYGFIIEASSPYGFFSKRYHLVIPIKFHVLPEINPLLKTRRNYNLINQKLKIPSPIGEFSHLREYQHGDPWKSVSWKISQRKQKLLVRMAYPEENEKQIIALDVSPSLFSGTPGYTPFDVTIPVIAGLARQLSLSVTELKFVLFNESELKSFKVNYKTDVTSLAGEYRFKTKNGNTELLLNFLLKHLRLNYGIHIHAEIDTEKSRNRLKKNLISFINKVPKTEKTILPDINSMKLKELIILTAQITGLELPENPTFQTDLTKLITKALKEGVNQLLIFGEYESLQNPEEFIKLTAYAVKKHVKIKFFILDSQYLLLRPNGQEILEKATNYGLNGLQNKIRSAGGEVYYWNPLRLSPFFKLLN